MEAWQEVTNEGRKKDGIKNQTKENKWVKRNPEVIESVILCCVNNLFNGEFTEPATLQKIERVLAVSIACFFEHFLDTHKCRFYR
jgi:hypothetical protein